MAADKVVTPAELQNLMGYLPSSENHFKHQFSGLRYTEGMKAVAMAAGAYWLIDAIASYSRKEEFQIWTLTVTEKDTCVDMDSEPPYRAVLTMKEDTNEPLKVEQKIEFTDFPVGKWKFYVSDGCLMAPSEY